jgi:hypothetical protein
MRKRGGEREREGGGSAASRSGELAVRSRVALLRGAGGDAVCAELWVGCARRWGRRWGDRGGWRGSSESVGLVCAYADVCMLTATEAASGEAQSQWG